MQYDFFPAFPTDRQQPKRKPQASRRYLRGFLSCLRQKAALPAFHPAYYFTFTVILYFLLPDLTVIVALPAFFAVITPLEETLATLFFEL